MERKFKFELLQNVMHISCMQENISKYSMPKVLTIVERGFMEHADGNIEEVYIVSAFSDTKDYPLERHKLNVVEIVEYAKLKD